MATSLASQLQALKSAVKADAEPLKRPFTRPSILFSPKDAADIDIDTIFSLALSGLEVLINWEERFRNYKNDLFSHKSRELDRELMGIEENNKINTSISSYLRLLSGYFELLAGRRTLEYLIRRYKVHLYNVEELILCALPYHETHEFVRVVLLIDTGNSRWKFLDGVKTSGAPPPRKVIVQQCLKDPGVLEVICNYATPTRKIHPLVPVTGFCTAVIIEVLGSTTTVDNDTVKRILPYVFSGLQPGSKGKLEQKAGALMIVGLLAQKVALSPSVVKSLVRAVAEVAREDAKKSNDLQWFRMTLMALINLVQLQHLEVIPKKIVDILTEIRDISQFLCGLITEFNIDTFVAVFLESLLEYSSSDKNFHRTLMEIIETVPLKDSVDNLVSKLLKTFLRVSKNRDQLVAAESGGQFKQIFVSLYKKYPVELREAVQEILQDNEVQSGKEGSNHDLLCRVLDGNLGFSSGIPDSKIWFALEHPKADVRCSALTGLDVAGVLNDNSVDSKGTDFIRDVILRRLEDDDLAVVGAVLTVERLNEMIHSQVLLDALQNVLKRCIHILMESSSNNKSLASDVAIASLQLAVTSFKHKDEYARTLATLIFPLVLILPKTQRVNLKALELSKEVKWPFYDRNLISLSRPQKRLQGEHISSVNLENISKLAEDFLAHPGELMPWLVECCNAFELSKTFFFLILLKSIMMPIIDDTRFFELYDDSFEILRSQWESLESAGNVQYLEEPGIRMIDGDCERFVEKLEISIDKLNSEIVICLFQRLLEAFIKTAPENDNNGIWLSKLQKLFIFFASQSRHVFRGHLHYLVSNCKILSPQFLSKMFTEEGIAVRVQIESLHSFSYLCSQLKDKLDGEQAESPPSVSHLSSHSEDQLLQEFPSILVALASNNQGVRTSAMSCIEGLFAIWSRRSLSRCKNGKSVLWVHFLGELLGVIIQQKRLILLDRNFLPSFFQSLLSSLSDNFSLQQTIGKRFDQSTKDEILAFLLVSALSLSAYGKLKIFSLLKDLGNKITEVNAIKSLLCDLLKRRHDYHIMHDKSSEKLSKTDLDTLCLLLESCTMTTTSFDRNDIGDLILKALELNGMFSEDPVISEPCVTVLRNLSSSFYGGLKTETQEFIFRDLVILFRNANASIQNAAREALLRIDISCSVVGKMLDSVLDHTDRQSGSSHGKKKKKKATTHQDSVLDVFQQRESALSFVSSLLDVMLLKKNIRNRSCLLDSLFKLVGKFFLNDEGVSGVEDEAKEYIQASSGVSQTVSSTQVYIQQELLLILEDISSSAITKGPQEGVIPDQFDLELLIKCARSTKDAVTRNHVFSLFSNLAKVMPDKVLDHILDILILVGESAITQWDGYSRRVFEDLVSAVFPFWLSKSGDMEKLLQIFVDVLPQVAQSQRLSIVSHLLRNLGESGSFSLMIFLLFRSLVSKKSLYPSVDFLTSVINSEWEYLFAKQLSEQYSCAIWLPSLVLLLQKIGASTWNDELFMELVVSLHFVLEKLLDPEIAFKIDAGEDSDMIQGTIGDLMEQVVCLLQLVDSNRKQITVSSDIRKQLKENMQCVLKTIAGSLAPSSYFKVIIQLLRHTDKNVRKKALGLLRETVKEITITSKSHERRGSSKSARNLWLQFDKTTQKCFGDMCLEILKLVDSSEDPAGAQLKLAAIVTLEVLANRLPSDDSIFSMCLNSVSKSICSNNPAVSSSCLRATGALIDVLGPRALSEIPGVMESMFSRSSNLSSFVVEENNNIDGDSCAASITLRDSVLVTLEAVIDKLGGFLNPYLSSILELVVLHPWYTSVSEVKLKAKVDVVRKLITDKIPVRLLLPPILRIYSEAVRAGESSLCVAFEMLGNIVGSMDKSAVVAYHVQIFDLCMQALDLRSQHPASVKNVNIVEENVINSIVILTTKLTETMFKPLFAKSIEWSGSHVEDSEFNRSKTVDRAISFYGLVNKLTETHRSLFVPYFKYLLDGCVHHLTDAEDTLVGLPQKKKKVKLQAGSSEKKYVNRRLTLEAWHLRALILSSLQKCFVYDTGNLKFLDDSNFQVLLKPVVLQLDTDPPSSLDQHPSIPSVKEVDDLLVVCIGQMAVTAGSDLLWKPLNHEVLMQTRSEKLRPRIVGLRIVKYLVENLKEEYLVLLPETIPFLGELLEDVELPVKTLAQEVLKEMESMSGESLREYL